MFLFENVRGLLTHDKGRTYATITNIFESGGIYHSEKGFKCVGFWCATEKRETNHCWN